MNHFIQELKDFGSIFGEKKYQRRVLNLSTQNVLLIRFPELRKENYFYKRVGRSGEEADRKYLFSEEQVVLKIKIKCGEMESVVWNLEGFELHSDLPTKFLDSRGRIIPHDKFKSLEFVRMDLIDFPRNEFLLTYEVIDQARKTETFVWKVILTNERSAKEVRIREGTDFTIKKINDNLPLAEFKYLQYYEVASGPVGDLGNEIQKQPQSISEGHVNFFAKSVDFRLKREFERCLRMINEIKIMDWSPGRVFLEDSAHIVTVWFKFNDDINNYDLEKVFPPILNIENPRFLKVVFGGEGKIIDEFCSFGRISKNSTSVHVYNAKKDWDTRTRPGGVSYERAIKEGWFYLVLYAPVLPPGLHTMKLFIRYKEHATKCIRYAKVPVVSPKRKKIVFRPSQMKKMDGEELKTPKKPKKPFYDWKIGSGLLQGALFKIFETLDLEVFDFEMFMEEKNKDKLSKVYRIISHYRHKRDVYGRTLLIHCAARGITFLVEYLLQIDGVDINAADNFMNTALHYAYMYNHKGMVKVLTNSCPKAKSNSVNCFGVTPKVMNLDIISSSAKLFFMETQCCVVNGMMNPALSNNLGFRKACEYGQVRLVSEFLRDIRVDPGDVENEALRRAVEKRSVQVVSLLLSAEGVDPTVHNNYPLIASAERGYLEILKMIIKLTKVDPSDQNNLALVISCKKGYTEIVDELLKDVRVNPYMENFVCLRKACRFGYLEIVASLLQDKVEREFAKVCPFSDDNFCLREALKNNHFDVAAYLIKYRVCQPGNKRTLFNDLLKILNEVKKETLYRRGSTILHSICQICKYLFSDGKYTNLRQNSFAFKFFENFLKVKRIAVLSDEEEKMIEDIAILRHNLEDKSFTGNVRNFDLYFGKIFDISIKDFDPVLIYAGFLRNGKKHGGGRLFILGTDPPVTSFYGKFRDGMKHGLGYVYKSGEIAQTNIYHKNKILKEIPSLLSYMVGEKMEKDKKLVKFIRRLVNGCDKEFLMESSIKLYDLYHVKFGGEVYTFKKYTKDVKFEELKREIRILEIMKDEFGESGENPVMALKSVVMNGENVGGFLFSDTCDTSVAQLIINEKSEKLSMINKLSILRQVVAVMEVMHHSIILHRDLKWDNVLIKWNEKDKPLVKIMDFGMAKYNCSFRYDRRHTFCGSHGYMAPEYFRYNTKISLPVDVYSFGIMMYELLFETLDPFEYNKKMKWDDGFVKRNLDYTLHVTNNSTIRPQIPDNTFVRKNAMIVDLMKRCWHSDEKKRPTFSQIQEALNICTNQKVGTIGEIVDREKVDRLHEEFLVKRDERFKYSRFLDKIITEKKCCTVEKMKELISQKYFDPNSYNSAILVRCCLYGHKEMVSYLVLELRVNPPGQALGMAVRNRHLDIVKILLKECSGLDPSYEENASLIIASTYGYHLIVSVLLKHVSPVVSGDKALFKAVQGGHIKVILMLVEDERMPTEVIREAIVVAKKVGKGNVQRILLEKMNYRYFS